MRLGFNVRRPSFNASALNGYVDRIKRRALFQFGGFVRQTARRSIRPAPGPSDPGRPPHSHGGQLRNNIFFHVEGDANVVIGPAALNMLAFDSAVQPVKGLVPQVLEYGGELMILEHDRNWDDEWQRIDGRFNEGKAKIRALMGGGRAGWMPFIVERDGRRRTHRLRARRVKIAARPYMAPAFEKGLAQLQRFFGDDEAPSRPVAAIAA